MRWFILIGGALIAVLVLQFRRPIKEFTGDFAFAERIFGSGGTNTFIVFLGVGVFIVSLMYFFGTFQAILDSILGPFFLA